MRVSQDVPTIGGGHRAAPAGRAASDGRGRLVAAVLYLLLLTVTLLALWAGADEPWATVAAVLPTVPIVVLPAAVLRRVSELHAEADRGRGQAAVLDALLQGFLAGAILTGAFFSLVLAGARAVSPGVLVALYGASWVAGVGLAATQRRRGWPRQAGPSRLRRRIQSRLGWAPGSLVGARPGRSPDGPPGRRGRSGRR